MGFPYIRIVACENNVKSLTYGNRWGAYLCNASWRKLLLWWSRVDPDHWPFILPCLFVFHLHRALPVCHEDCRAVCLHDVIQTSQPLLREGALISQRYFKRWGNAGRPHRASNLPKFTPASSVARIWTQFLLKGISAWFLSISLVSLSLHLRRPEDNLGCHSSGAVYVCFWDRVSCCPAACEASQAVWWASHKDLSF